MATFIFTGGHHNSALVLAKNLKKNGHSIVWLGHRFASRGNENISQEYIDVVNSGIKFIELKAGKFHQSNFFNIFKNISSLFYCLTLFNKYKPQAVISFGGYLSVSPVLAAWLSRIPTFGHEQTNSLGRANSFLLKFYKKLFITWPNPKLEKNKKIVKVGLPIEDNHFQKIDKKRLNIILEKHHGQTFSNLDKPLLVISGGKQGCHVLNKTIEKNLKTLLANYNIFHQAGNNSVTRDLKRLNKKRDSLTQDLKGSYIVCDYSQVFTQIMSAANLIIGRSGAHTSFEILNLIKRFIAIPLPFAYANEQYKNAQILQSLSLAFIIDQKDLTPELLSNIIPEILDKEIDQNRVEEYLSNNFSGNSTQVMIQEIAKVI